MYGVVPCAVSVYADYAAKVRKEYIVYPQLDYCKGRAAFLEGCLKKPIFASKAFRLQYEYQARENLKVRAGAGASVVR